MAFPRRAAVMLAFLIGLFGTIPLQAGSYDQSLLWRIEKPGTAPSHVFGTMHSDDSRVVKLSPATSAAFKGSQRFVMEMKLDAAAIGDIQRAMLLPTGKLLPQLVGDDLWQRLSRVLQARGVPAQMFAGYQPWAVAVTLSMPPARGPVLDMQLAQQAAGRAMPVSGLETAAEQMAVFDGLTDDQQTGYLADTLDAIESGEMERNLADMTERYVAGDLAGLVALADKMNDAISDAKLLDTLMVRLIDDRNQRMAERVESSLQAGGAFVAIGALHLPGDDGVLARLARAGWQVTPVR